MLNNVDALCAERDRLKKSTGLARPREKCWEATNGSASQVVRCERHR
jgi:hypothetical protein